MGHPAHPCLQHFENSHLYAKDLQVIGIEEFQVFTGRQAPERLIFSIRHTSTVWKWEVVYDYYEWLKEGEIVNTGDALKVLHKNLYTHSFRTAWAKVIGTDYAFRDINFPVKCEYLYKMDIGGKKCYSLIPMCNDKGINGIRDMLRPHIDWKKSGLHQKQKARKSSSYRLSRRSKKI